jgi:hypothetical protein
MFSLLNLGSHQHLIFSDGAFSFQNEEIELLDTSTGNQILDVYERKSVLHDKAVCVLTGWSMDADYKNYLDGIQVRRTVTEGTVSKELLISVALRVLYPKLPNISVNDTLKSTDVLVRVTDEATTPVETHYRGCRIGYHHCGTDEKSVVFQASAGKYRTVCDDNGFSFSPSLLLARVARTQLENTLQFVCEHSDISDIKKQLAVLAPSISL